MKTVYIDKNEMPGATSLRYNKKKLNIRFKIKKLFVLQLSNHRKLFMK